MRGANSLTPHPPHSTDDGCFSSLPSVIKEGVYLCNAGRLFKAYSELPMQVDKANT